MNIYEYNSSTINEYLTEDCGLLSSSVGDIFDYGNISEIVKETQDFYIVTCSETLYPFGTITIKRNTKSKFKKVGIHKIRKLKQEINHFLRNHSYLVWLWDSI